MPKAKSKTHSTGKRILSVTVKRIADYDSPDTSDLGEYSDTKTSEFSIDRAHDEDCAINTGKPVEQPPHTLYECGCCDSLHPWTFNGDSREDSNRYANVSDYAERNKIEESKINVLSADDRASADSGELCDCCGENLPNRGYHYFNPSFNYVDKHGHALPGNTPEEVRKYVRQDFDRMERLAAGDWCYIGIQAEAEIGIGDVAQYPKKYGVTCQKITSGGLWGVESDSEASYIEEEEKNQLADLRTQLRALGFSTRAISKAFKTVERKDA